MADGKRQRKGKPAKKKAQLREEARKARAARRRSEPDPSGERRSFLIVSIAHPVRRRIFLTIGGSDESLSPREISEMLGLPIGLVTYHATILYRCGAVEPTPDTDEEDE